MPARRRIRDARAMAAVGRVQAGRCVSLLRSRVGAVQLFLDCVHVLTVHNQHRAMGVSRAFGADGAQQ